MCQAFKDHEVKTHELKDTLDTHAYRSVKAAASGAEEAAADSQMLSQMLPATNADEHAVAVVAQEEGVVEGRVEEGMRGESEAEGDLGEGGAGDENGVECGMVAISVSVSISISISVSASLSVSRSLSLSLSLRGGGVGSE